MLRNVNDVEGNPYINEDGSGNFAFNQSAYHGTPHSFERFDLGAIGSGEGHQAHGWGLYFAANKEIAEGYREKLIGEAYGARLNGVKYKKTRNQNGAWIWVNSDTNKPNTSSAISYALQRLISNRTKERAIRDINDFLRSNTSDTPFDRRLVAALMGCVD